MRIRISTLIFLEFRDNEDEQPQNFIDDYKTLKKKQIKNKSQLLKDREGEAQNEVLSSTEEPQPR